MEYTNLGRTGLRVSRLCLGTMNFGPKTTEPDSFAIMDRALEHGINFFDTANVYGWKLGEGVTEQIIGRWIAQGGGRREKIVLATKVYGKMSDWPNNSGLSAREVVPAAIEHGIGIIPWSPLHGGLLSGALRKQREGTGARSSEGRSTEGLAEHRDTIEAYEKLAAELGHDPSNIALAWLLSRPGVTAPIIGPRTMAQLDGALDALGITLDSPTLARLDELFPPVGAGGPGPEAWGSCACSDHGARIRRSGPRASSRRPVSGRGGYGPAGSR